MKSMMSREIFFRYAALFFFMFSNLCDASCDLAVNTSTSERPKVYYAHALNTYGTKVETRDLALLASLLPHCEIVNPNAPVHDEGYQSGGMDYFVKLCDSCSICAFRALPDGAIPAGIAKEIESFLARGAMVIELPTALHRRTLTVEETRDVLRDSGFR